MILINNIGLYFIAFYLAPKELGLPIFFPEKPILNLIPTLTLIITFGRLFDAITDPLIAKLSDRLKAKTGSRKLFLIGGLFPTVIFFSLLFICPVNSPSHINTLWLILIQISFYMALTTYRIPYLALMSDLARSAKDRVNFATSIAMASSISIIVVSLSPLIWHTLYTNWGFSTLTARQTTLTLMSILAGVLMIIPILFVPDRTPAVTDSNLAKPSIRQTLKIKAIRIYMIYIGLFSMGYIFIISGLPYYIIVLLQLPETTLSILLPLLVLIMVTSFPFINILSKKVSLKTIIVLATATFSIAFLYASMLGTYPFSPMTQAIIAVILSGIPLACLKLVPLALLSNISEILFKKTNLNLNAILFGSKEFVTKLGMALGSAIFTWILIFGKDIDNPTGIRLSAVIATTLTLLSAVIFTRFEKPK